LFIFYSQNAGLCTIVRLQYVHNNILGKENMGTAWARHVHRIGTVWARLGHGISTAWARHWHGMGTALARHGQGMGTAWARQAMC